jgi:hypothetical protein
VRSYEAAITTGSGSRGGSNGVRSSGVGPNPVKVQVVPSANALLTRP